MATVTAALEARAENHHCRRSGQHKKSYRCPGCGTWTRLPLLFLGKEKALTRKGRVLNGRCFKCDPTVATEVMLSSFAVRSLEQFVQSWGIEMEAELLDEEEEEETEAVECPLPPFRNPRLEQELFGSYQHHFLHQHQQLDCSGRSDAAVTIGSTYTTPSQRLYLEEIQKFWLAEADVDVTFQIITIKGRFQVKAHQCIVAARCPALLKFLICQRQQDDNEEGSRHKIVDLSNSIIGKYPQLLRSVIELCYGGIYDYDQNLLKEQERIIEDYLGKEYVPVAHMKQIQRDMSYLIEFVDADFAVGGVQPDVVIYGRKSAGIALPKNDEDDSERGDDDEWMLYAHSAILCAHSEYFRVQLMYGWPATAASVSGDADGGEKHGMRVIRLDSTQFTKEITQQILHACYTLSFDLHAGDSGHSDSYSDVGRSTTDCCSSVKIPNIHDAFSDFESSKSCISSSGRGSGSGSNSTRRKKNVHNNDNNIDLHTIFKIYEGADYLRIGCVCLYCEEILGSILSEDNLIEIWDFAEHFCATNIIQNCEKFLCENFIKIQKHHSSMPQQVTDGYAEDNIYSTFSRLNIDRLQKMLLSSSEDYVVEGTEQQILNAILQWLSVQRQGEKRGKERERERMLMTLVRFPLVPLDCSEMFEVRKRNLITEEQVRVCCRFQTDSEFQSDVMEKMIMKMAGRDEQDDGMNEDNDEVDNVFNVFQLKDYQLRRNQSNMSYISQRLMNNGGPSVQYGRQRRQSRLRQFFTSLSSV